MHKVIIYVALSEYGFIAKKLANRTQGFKCWKRMRQRHYISEQFSAYYQKGKYKSEQTNNIGAS